MRAELQNPRLPLVRALQRTQLWRRVGDPLVQALREQSHVFVLWALLRLAEILHVVLVLVLREVLPPTRTVQRENHCRLKKGREMLVQMLRHTNHSPSCVMMPSLIKAIHPVMPV